MSLSKVRTALVNAYLGGNHFTKDNTAFENLAFTPPKTPWAKFNFIPVDSVIGTLGIAGTNRETGLVQIDVNYPLNTGTKAAGDMADALGKTFTAGRGFSYSGQEVKISSCGRSQGRIVEGFYRVSVTARWYADVVRNP